MKSALQKAIEESRSIYLRKRIDRMQELKERYRLREIDKYQYISEMFECSKALFEITRSINSTSIQKVLIENGRVIFTIDPYGINLEVDESCRSAPFEILNFGNYEQEDETMAFNLIKNGDIIFDVGAHLGWYALNFSKRFPNSQIYSFEPIGRTFDILKRNIEMNSIENVSIYNVGLSNRDGLASFYYSEVGSPLSSEENIFNVESYQKIDCTLRTLDNFVLSENIEKIDFIKCDVEGSEFNVLKGCKNVLNRFCPILVLEFVEYWCHMFGHSANDVIKHLSDHGYWCFLVYDDKLRKVEAVDLDNDQKHNYFFLHSVKHQSLIDKFIETL